MQPNLARFGLGDPDWLDPATAAVAIAIAVVAAIIFNRLLFPIILRLTRWTPTDLDSRLVRATRWPLTVGIILLGIYLSLTLSLDLTDGSQDTLNKISKVLGAVLGIMVVVAVVSNAINWYLETLATRTNDVVDVRLFPLLRRIAVAIVYGLGGLLILDLMGINISPLIAGLGLGGLAVALALQPTLANLFAGTYVLTEGVISPGDYIELEGEVTGYVVEVGWRSTRIRNWKNNLVVIPNAKFAETIITNYQEPNPYVNIYLTCGVSYGSDLELVEKVSRECMTHILETHPGAVQEYGSYFAFSGFSDSNVDFWLFIQAKGRSDAFYVQSALIIRMLQRFKQEGIVINYPVRSLEFPKGWDAAMARNGGIATPARRSRNGGGRRSLRRRRPRRDFHLSQGEEPQGVSGTDDASASAEGDASGEGSG